MVNKFWAGVFWKVFSCGSFAGINILVRYLNGGSPLSNSEPMSEISIICFQNLLGAFLIFTWIFSKNKKIVSSFKTESFPLHAGRVVAALLGTVAWYTSLQFLPVTEVVALSFIAPIITIFLAIVFLKEKISFTRFFALAASILGGYLMVRPDKIFLSSQELNLYLILPIFGSLCFALSKVFTKKLIDKKTKPETLTFSLMIFMGASALIVGIKLGITYPTLNQLPLIILLAGVSASAHFSFSKAYSYADVTSLLPFGVTKVLLSAVFSYIFFYFLSRGEHILLGILILTLSSILLGIKPEFFRNRKKSLILN